jgi:Tfp pilus assembly protein PilO
MRRLYRRDKHQLVFGGLVAGVGIISMMFFLILYLPTRLEFGEVGETIIRLERESQEREAELERLEATGGQLDEARTDRLRFLASRLIPRNEGFAAMIPDMERLAQLASISRERVVYTFNEQPEFGLYSVGINMPVRGGYTAVTQLIEELEGADTIFILDSIGLNRAGDSQQDQLTMSLDLSTFFSYQQ